MGFENNDQPIKSIEEDNLAFASLAKQLANGINSTKKEGSYTIAIEGRWGSGKTSLVNMVRQNLKDDVIVLKFNPWFINDFKQLTEYFFSEFQKIILNEIPNKKFWHKDNLSKKIDKLRIALRPDSVKFNIKIPIIGDIAITKKFNQSKEPTIDILKAEINKELLNLDKTIVIIVDDIDRLTDSETETFFRLIKGIADFQNVVYLLLYDKKIVSKSLEKSKDGNGEKFLDKVVQYSVSVPKIYPDKLFMILDKSVKALKPKYWDKKNGKIFKSLQRVSLKTFVILIE